MLEAIKYLLFPIFISILILIPAMLFDTWLSKIGIGRGSRGVIILATLSLAYVKQIFLPDISWLVMAMIMLFTSTIVAHRTDFGETLKYGKWWWEKDISNRKNTRKSPTPIRHKK